MPDHLPYFISLEYVQTVNTPPKFIQIKQHSPEAINKLKLELLNSNICHKLNNEPEPDETNGAKVLIIVLRRRLGLNAFYFLISLSLNLQS